MIAPAAAPTLQPHDLPGRRRVTDTAETPSLQGSTASLFLVGRDSRGHWAVQDQSGLCGGLFVGRAEALKFAKFESGNRSPAVVMVPGVLELDMRAKSRTCQAKPIL